MAEGAPLLAGRTERFRGFDSHPVRGVQINGFSFDDGRVAELEDAPVSNSGGREVVMGSTPSAPTIRREECVYQVAALFDSAASAAWTPA